MAMKYKIHGYNPATSKYEMQEAEGTPMPFDKTKPAIFAIRHVPPAGESAKREDSVWKVDHLPTGMGIITYHKKAEALRLIKSLNGQHDVEEVWSFTKDHYDAGYVQKSHRLQEHKKAAMEAATGKPAALSHFAKPCPNPGQLAEAQFPDPKPDRKRPRRWYHVPVRALMNNSRMCRTEYEHEFYVTAPTAADAANHVRDQLKWQAECEVFAYGPKGGEVYRYVGWETSVGEQMMDHPSEKQKLDALLGVFPDLDVNNIPN